VLRKFLLIGRKLLPFKPKLNLCIGMHEEEVEQGVIAERSIFLQSNSLTKNNLSNTLNLPIKQKGRR